MKSILLLFLFIFLHSLAICAQKVVIRGTIATDSLDYYYVSIFSARNNNTQIYFEKDFQIECEYEKELSLKIYSMGYDTLSLTVNIEPYQANYDVGAVDLKQSVFSIDEVVVLGKKKVEFRNGNIEINPRGTALSYSGTLVDMLRATPGLIPKNQDQFEVIGKGAPVVYVDGRQILNSEELSVILSSNIRSIKVIRNPSSRYGGSVTCVVEIETIQKLKDNYTANLANTLTTTRKVSDKQSVGLSFRKNKLTFSAAYDFNVGGNLVYSNILKSIKYPTYDFESFSDGALDVNFRSHTALTSMQYDITSKSTIKMQYLYRGSNSVQTDNNSVYIYDGRKEIFKEISNVTKPNRRLHNASLNYRYKADNNEFNIILDYANVDNISLSNINEKNKNSLNSLITELSNKNRYNIVTGDFNYKTILPYKIDFEGGSKASYVTNNSNMQLLSLNRKSEYSNLKDFIIACYLNLKKEWNFGALELGVRCEYSQNNIDIPNYSDKIKLSNFFPNLSFNFPISPKLDMSVAYSKRIWRPSFSQLNPTRIYEDSFSYTAGNPLLKPTLEDEVSLNLGFNDMLSLSLSYTASKNQIVQTYITDENEKNTLKMIPVNISKSKLFGSYIAFSHGIKNLRFNGSVGLTLPNLTVPTVDEELKLNKLAWKCSAGIDWKVIDNFHLYTNFSYSSTNYNLTTYSFPTNNLRVGAIASFFKKKMTVTLEGTDLLDGSNWNNWNESYLNVTTRSRGNYDMRGVVLRVSYIFNNKKISSRAKNGNADVLQRVD